MASHEVHVSSGIIGWIIALNPVGGFFMGAFIGPVMVKIFFVFFLAILLFNDN
jgi:hypothetical protein